MEKPDHPPAPFILGIDLGTNSLGWVSIGLDQEKPARLDRCGARVFDAGQPLLRYNSRTTGRAIRLLRR